MTLAVPGSEDVTIAADLARRFGMVHHVVTLDGLEALGAAEAYQRCVTAARRLSCMADPLAFASLSFAEEQMVQGPRISGLGGEVARGFYYFGPAFGLPVTTATTRVLAAWRMFANEAVADDLLEPEFSRWAREFTIREIHTLLAESGQDWLRATDELYFRQRMQRWAGVTDTAVCFDREMVNPMLDRRFLDIAPRPAPTGEAQVTLSWSSPDPARPRSCRPTTRRTTLTAGLRDGEREELGGALRHGGPQDRPQGEPEASPHPQAPGGWGRPGSEGRGALAPDATGVGTRRSPGHRSPTMDHRSARRHRSRPMRQRSPSS